MAKTRYLDVAPRRHDVRECARNRRGAQWDQPDHRNPTGLRQAGGRRPPYLGVPRMKSKHNAGVASGPSTIMPRVGLRRTCLFVQ